MTWLLCKHFLNTFFFSLKISFQPPNQSPDSNLLANAVLKDEFHQNELETEKEKQNQEEKYVTQTIFTNNSEALSHLSTLFYKT